MKLHRALGLLGLVLGGGHLLLAGKPPPHPGVIAASAGSAVVLADPDGRWTRPFDAGTVGWLYEAPGGVLFAPDLVSGRTTVLDLRTLRVADRFDGVTTPHFGESPDRYVVVAGDVLVLSYPDRAPIGRVAAAIDAPWQVLMVTDTVFIALDRGRDGGGPSVLTAVDLVTKQVVYRRVVTGDIQRIAVSARWGLLGLADAASGTIHLVSPANLAPVLALSVDGLPHDLAFVDDGRTLAAVSALESGAGELRLWVLKKGDRVLKVKKTTAVPLTDRPRRLAVAPAGDRVAVGLDAKQVVVVDVRKRRQTATIDLPAAPRDVVWCDPTRPGPLLPSWSSDEPPELRLDAPKKAD